MPSNNLVGLEVGRLTVLEEHEIRSFKTYWNCQCSCGKTKFVRSDHLTSCRVQSCGCLQREHLKAANHVRKHGMSHKPEWYVWSSMIQRCNNPNATGFDHYGGRGITVCEEWYSFDQFYEDMGPRPDGLSIERIDNSKGYSPDNCKWATQHDQVRNTRRNVWLTAYGHTMIQSDWARRLGCSPSYIWKLLKKGWSMERIVDKYRYNFEKGK